MPNGILIIDKPQDWTSMDVCAKVRGIFHEKRVGHGGTLDPLATGVLPVFVGQATKGVEFAENSEKEYIAGLRLGIVTDTQDTTGAVLETHPVTADRAAVEAALARFTGPQEQIPPMYSAVKVNGQKLYELARKGREVERRPRPVTIHALELLSREGADGLPAPLPVLQGHLHPHPLPRHRTSPRLRRGPVRSLRRTMAAGYTQARAVTLERVQAQGDVPPAAHRQPRCRVLPRRDICPAGPGGEAGPLRQPHHPAGHEPDGTCRVYGQDRPVPVPVPGRAAAPSRPSRISLERKP